MKRLKNRNIFLLLTIILSLGITLGAVYFMYQYRDSRENELKTGMISLNFTEKSEVINLSSNVPMIDDLGLKSRPYEFTITNTSKVPIKTKIMLDVDKTTTIKYGAVRYALFINEERVIKDFIHRDNLTLYEVSELKPNEVINCKLYFGIDYYYDYPGEIFKAKIKAVGESIDELQQEAITVTFDADGGTLNTTTKEVYYHGYYGELPAPTKEGYTFMGWNGKNLIKIDNFNDTFTNLHYKEYTSIPKYLLTINTTYTLSFSCQINFISNKIFTSIGYGENRYARDIKFGSLYSSSGIKEITFTTPSTFDLNSYVWIRFARQDSSVVTVNIDFSNIQLEEGTVATEYEPYYITSNTKVVQNHDHILKAIWKENS